MNKKNMLKYKILFLVALFSFVEVSCESEAEEEESFSLVQKAKSTLKSVWRSPVISGLLFCMLKNRVQFYTLAGFSHFSKSDNIQLVLVTLNALRDKKVGVLGFINNNLPSSGIITNVFSTCVAYYVSGKIVYDSDANRCSRLLGALFSFTQVLNSDSHNLRYNIPVINQPQPYGGSGNNQPFGYDYNPN